MADSMETQPPPAETAPEASSDVPLKESEEGRPTRRRKAPTKYETYVSEGEDDDEEPDDSDDDPSYGTKPKNDSDDEVDKQYAGMDDESGKRGKGRGRGRGTPAKSMSPQPMSQRPQMASPYGAPQQMRMPPMYNYPAQHPMQQQGMVQENNYNNYQQQQPQQGIYGQANSYPQQIPYNNMMPRAQPPPQPPNQNATQLQRWVQQRQALMNQLRKQQQSVETQTYNLTSEQNRLPYMEEQRLNPSVDPNMLENEIFMLRSSIQSKSNSMAVSHLQMEILQQQLCMMNKGIANLQEPQPVYGQYGQGTPYMKQPLYGQDPSYMQQQQYPPYMKQQNTMSHKLLNEQAMQMKRDAAESRPLTQAEAAQRARLQNLALFDSDFRNQNQRLSSINSYSPMGNRPAGFPPGAPQQMAPSPMSLAQQKAMMMRKKKLGSDDEEEGEFSEEEDDEDLLTEDPARKQLLQITRQCESYANKMRKVLSQWQAKSKAKKADGGSVAVSADSETNDYATLMPSKAQAPAAPPAPTPAITPTPAPGPIQALGQPPAQPTPAVTQPAEGQTENPAQTPGQTTSETPAPPTESQTPGQSEAPVQPNESPAQQTENPGQAQPIAQPTAPEGEKTEKSEEDLPDIDLITQPENLKYELRPYQLIGLNWLYLLFQQKINGILADEMGLGKTIQTISLFSLLAQRGEATKPHVVIAPSTALENWVREFKIWCPSLRVVMYHGTQKDREILRKQLVPKDSAGKASTFDVLITTYNICINKTDRVKLFKKVKFSFIVLDEAHNVKNVGSVRYRNLLKLAFRAEYRLMLTGTPLQNNINELWTLLSFLMPGIFSKNKDFTTLVWEEEKDQEGEEGAELPKSKTKDIRSLNERLRSQNSKIVDKLKTILAPFVLRRMKADVLGKLPPKTEKVKWCDLTNSQRETYAHIHQYSKSKYHEITSEPSTAPEVKKEEPKGIEPVTESAMDISSLISSSDTNNYNLGDFPSVNAPEVSKFETTDLAGTKSEETGKVEEKQVKEEEKPARRGRKNMEEELDDTVDKEKPTLNHLMMQLRKAANNTLLFRNIYTDDKIREIEALVDAETKKEAEEAEKRVEQQNAFALSELEKKQNEAPASPKEKSEEAEPRGDTKPYSIDDDCGICGQAGELIMCDGPCKRAFHMTCVGLPPDHVIPENEPYYCPECQSGGLQGEHFNKAACDEILNEIENTVDEDGRLRCELFMWLPSRDEYPSYFEIIKEPISLNMIRRKPWQSAEAFRDALHLMFKNARTFNAPKSEVFLDAAEMEKVFVKEFSKRFPGVKADRTPARKPAKRKVDSEATTPVKRTRRKSVKEDDDNSDEPTPRPAATPTRSRAKKARKNDDDDEAVVSPDEDTPRKGRKSGKGRGKFDEDTPRRSTRQKSTSRLCAADFDEDDDIETYLANRQNAATKARAEKANKVKLEEPFSTCLEILEDLLDQKDKDSDSFSDPVDYQKLGLKDYLEVVKEPMDLGTVHTNLLEGKFTEVKDFVGDVRKVFDNCLLYNEASSSIGISAQELWSYFKQQCRKAKISVDDPAKLGSARHVGLTVFEELEDKTDYQIDQFCMQHEYLKEFRLTDEQIFASSGKLVQMKKIMEKCHKRNDRIIIFSQFTAVLDILEEFLRRLSHRFVRLDGQTPVLERQEIIDEYNRDPGIFVFLLSTRAGGIGINLTSANVCIFHDIDWNPEMDRQAEARIHRIGQLRPVTVIRLLSKQSVDQYIYDMSSDKKMRNDVVMGNNQGAEIMPSGEQKFSIGNVLADIFK